MAATGSVLQLAQERALSVPCPESERRAVPEDADVVRAGDVEGWEVEDVGYTFPHASDATYARISRVSYAADEPTAVEWGASGGFKHLLPAGSVGTNNLCLPPAIASFLQHTRRADVDATNTDDVAGFVNTMASVAVLYYPIVLGKILGEAGGSASDVAVEAVFNSLATGEEVARSSYIDAINSPASLGLGEVTETRVPTVGGAHSVAGVVPGLHTTQASLEVTGSVSGVRFVFVDIQRGGCITSVLGAALSEQFGIQSVVVACDAKRRHTGDATTGVSHIDVTPPKGYDEAAPPEHSEFVEGFVGPAGWLEFAKHEEAIHIFWDPMFATGRSCAAVADTYSKIVGCDVSKVWMVCMFAGGYDGLDVANELGANVLILAHDNADLNVSKYIQPGLGDAGDRLAGEDGLLDYDGYVRMLAGIGEARGTADVKKWLNDECAAVLGRRV